jgi:hypothetical protein
MEDITQKKVLIFLGCCILVFLLMVAIPVLAEVWGG